MEMSEAANLVFQWIFVLNAIKHKLLYVSIVKEILRADQKLWGCTIFGPKMVHLHRTKMFWEKALIFFFLSLLGPFTVHKILKKFLERIQSYEDAPFLGPKLPIYSKQGFVWKKSILFSYTYKKFSRRIQSYKSMPLLGPKWPICPKKNFLGKVINIIFIYL